MVIAMGTGHILEFSVSCLLLLALIITQYYNYSVSCKLANDEIDGDMEDYDFEALNDSLFVGDASASS